MALDGGRMCLILFSLDNHPGFRLILGANRDEFYNRPTQPLSAWPEAPEVYGGRDLKEGGTWLGVSRRGRLAALTNYRDPAHHIAQAPSRGQLTRRFLTGDASAAEYLAQVLKTAQRYNGFNLLVGDRTGLWYVSNRGNGIVRLQAGIHGLSNHLLDTDWPKVTQGKKRLKNLLSRGDGWDPEGIFTLLDDRTAAPDQQLPDTGVGLEWERTLSPVFIASPNYGTRSSTVVLIRSSGAVTVVERTFNRRAPSVTAVAETRSERFTICPSGQGAASAPTAP
jgi:uncharacterized protein with NRDE domain